MSLRRSNRPTHLPSVAVSVLAVVAGASPVPQEGGDWQRVLPGAELTFPNDHGAHPSYQTEWWYLTGEARTADGRAFGFQFTVFRFGLDPTPVEEGQSPLRLRHVLAAHLAVTDVAGERTLFAERARRSSSPLARAAEGELDLAVEDWSLRRGRGDRLRVRAADLEQGIGLVLDLEPKKPLVLHGDGGVSAKGEGEGNASVYVSWPRLAVGGTLTVDGRGETVRGEAWFDHEFGSSVLGEGVAGWDWAGLTLEDGRELMLFVLRRADGGIDPASAGTLVAADGTATALQADDFRFESTGTWESPRTGARYPARWRVAVPVHGIELDLEPRVPDCEIDARGSVGVVYWEGPVAVGGTVAGRGYVELTGYAGPMLGKF